MTIDWQVEYFDSLSSTMDVVHDRAQNGAPQGLVIVAAEQSKGRGRRGNEWIASPGNLYCSLLLRPKADLKDRGQYAFIAAVALADCVKNNLKPGFIYRHKWPNDGLLNDRKFAGILLEGGADYLNMGMGVNIVSAPDDREALNNCFAYSVTAPEFLNSYLTSFSKNLDLHANKGFAPIREAWLKDAKGLNENVTVRLPNDTLQGVFNGLDEDGALLLGLANGGQKVIHSGEVYFGKDI